jgi:predicted PurR-regulated permease PerM
MFSLDDRTGNVLTTITTFSLAAAILYSARGSLFILLLSLFFAYLLEPAVTLAQRHSRLGRRNRAWAIAQVYLIGTLLVAGFGYGLGPSVAAQVKNLNAAIPVILESISSGKAPAGLVRMHGVTAAQQRRIEALVARNRDLITQAFESGAAAVGYAAARAIWLFAVPVLAIFFLQNGRQMADAVIGTVEPPGEQTLAQRILHRIDAMLAKYVRAQLALSGLSFAFYSLSMLILGFPYAIALSVLGAALESLPTVGWIASAAVILIVGILTHSHWIWMGVLLVVWRLVQDYVNSPRIMRDSLELQPLTVIVALMVGGEVGGIAGLYLSVPVVAALRIVCLECFSHPSPIPSVQRKHGEPRPNLLRVD